METGFDFAFGPTQWREKDAKNRCFPFEIDGVKYIFLFIILRGPKKKRETNVARVHLNC